MAEPTPSLPPERLQSIDALRGFDMLWIVGGDAFFQSTAKAFSADPWVAQQMEHVDWEGFRFYDLIFPLFLFLVGVVLPFSLYGERLRGASLSGQAHRILRRVLLLFGLGLMCNGALQLTWLTVDSSGWHINFADNLRVTGVLQRIAVCYGLAAIVVLMTGVRGQAIALLAILLGYWALLAWTPVPGGVAGDLSKEGNLAGWVDRHYLPGKILTPYYGYGDNEGLLSTIPAVATVLLGALAGHWLRTPYSKAFKFLGLVGAGGACLATGMAWSIAFPIIKNLWTSSYILVAGGWSLLLLALFYGIIDALGWRKWAFPFIVIGMNAITIYVVPRFLDFRKPAVFFLGGVSRFMGDFGPVLIFGTVLILEWLVLYWLYRRRWFLRVIPINPEYWAERTRNSRP